METLAQIYERYKGPASYGDKGTIHSYIEVYEELFAPYRNSALRVLEIGIMGGCSLRMWEEYFAYSEVHGIDLCDQPLGMTDLRPMIKEAGHHIHLLDASNKEQVEACFHNVVFDVVVEDANHFIDDQLKIYDNFRRHLSTNGIYVIEDIEDIERDKKKLESIDSNRRVRILDRRNVKGRFDDVLVVIGGV